MRIAIVHSLILLVAYIVCCDAGKKTNVLS